MEEKNLAWNENLSKRCNHPRLHKGIRGLIIGKSSPSISTIILPCDPTALVERFDILMASKAAGKTGVRNELVSVCDELLRQKLIEKNKYKIIMLQL